MVHSLYGTKDAQETICVFLEHADGQLKGISIELLSKGRIMADQVGWRLAGLMMGERLSGLTQQAFAYGADHVTIADHPLLGDFTIDAYRQIAYQAVMQEKPNILLFGATPNGRDLAGVLAVRLRTGLNADCTNLSINPETHVLVSEVSGFGGGVLALIEMQNHRPQMATVRPGVFSMAEPDEKREGEVISLPVQLTREMIQTRLIERVVGEGVDLTQAEVLVVGGRGLGGDFDDIQKLSALLEGEIGVTRPCVDSGYAERERMVGQTGTVCRPKIAIVCGASGAFHFLVGIQHADLVIAINTDPDAPIFDHADYCILGDASQVLPALVKALRELRELNYA